MRSVWLRNSLRGALGLALAVLIAQLAEVQHSFWVVLGTMSVLRSSALATGSRIGPALLGTLAGIVVGGLLVIGVDNNPTALWILLPLVAALAAYSPSISFAAGQAAFSVAVLVLFNLIDPTGWQVGLLRIEDVAIGAGVSLVVGLLFWPRGAVGLVRRALAAAYTSAAAFLDAAIDALLDGRDPPPEARRQAFDAGQMLDGTVRDFLSERSSSGTPVEELVTLMAGSTRLYDVARLLGDSRILREIEPASKRSAEAALGLGAERERRCGWYVQLADSIAEREVPPAPEPAPEAQIPLAHGIGIAWAHQYLQALRRFEEPLNEAAADL